MKLRITALILVLVLSLSLFAGCGANTEKPNGDNSSKINATIILVLEDGSEKTYEINVTKDSNLRDALYEAKLITEETYSALFVDNIDGNIADTLNDGCMWMPTDTDGNQIMGMFDDIIVKDGQTIKLVYTVAPTFDD